MNALLMERSNHRQSRGGGGIECVLVRVAIHVGTGVSCSMKDQEEKEE